MKYPFKSLLLAATVLAAASCAKDDTQSGGEETAGPVIVNASPAAIGGEIILKLKTEASGIVEKSRAQGVSKGSGIDEIDRILNTVNTVRFERLFPDGGRFEERTRREGLHLWYYAKYDPSVPTSEMASLLSSCKDIEIIEYSLAAETSDHRRAASPAAGAQSVTRAIADEVRNVPFPFNESERSQQMQWHYNNTGNIFAQTSQLGADANVYAAWQLSTGSPDVIVAVVDQGVKYDHEDLAANMWTNTAELNGSEGRDDDSNGYADDIHGFNFVDNTTLTISTKGDAPDHGTHVAGTVAAVNNNGTGVAGIAGGSGKNDGVKIMSCQIFSGGKGGTISTSVQAIRYAADNGASIIQCSWGYPTQAPLNSDRYYENNYSVEKETIDYFVSKKNNDVLDGGLAIFAAGNDATNFASYPGGYRSYVSVTSFGPDYLPAYYTNYGPGCNVAAPGGDASISPAGTSAAQVLSTLPSELPAELGTDGADYGYMQGTSMACPHVSGVAALGLSYALAKGRHYTVDEFKSMLLTAVNDIDSYIIGGTKNGMVLRNYRKNMGTGSIDAYQLLMQIEGTPCLPAKVGVQQVLSLDKFFGQASANLTYKSAEMSQADMDKLGITAAPAFSYGKLQIKCTKPGVAKIKIKAMAGSSSANGEMSGMEITKEFAIIARAVQAGNGGWL